MCCQATRHAERRHSDVSRHRRPPKSVSGGQERRVDDEQPWFAGFTAASSQPYSALFSLSFFEQVPHSHRHHRVGRCGSSLSCQNSDSLCASVASYSRHRNRQSRAAAPLVTARSVLYVTCVELIRIKLSLFTTYSVNNTVHAQTVTASRFSCSRRRNRQIPAAALARPPTRQSPPARRPCHR